MTTIAYRDGVIAADTLATAGGTRVGTIRKVGKIGPLLFGAAGALSDCQRFMDWIARGMKGEQPKLGDGDNGAEGFIVYGDSVLCFNGEKVDRIEARRYACGSGWKMALAAMEAGASAREAVEIACRLDAGSGGEITVLTR